MDNKMLNVILSELCFHLFHILFNTKMNKKIIINGNENNLY